ncbi:hypothetical protein POUND7_005807 [Theobroma cacao]
MMKTLEKYQKCSYSTVDTSRSASETQSSYQECLKLKARVEVLQRSQRNLLGEDLGPLNTKELEQLENQLETSLKQIRSTKSQAMLDQLGDLQNREQMLVETNKSLRRKYSASLLSTVLILVQILFHLLEELSAQPPFRLAWETGGQNIPYNRLPAQSEGFFQLLGGSSSFRIGYLSCN